MKSSRKKMWLGLVMTSVLIGFLLFIAAGTLDYLRAWIYLGVNAASSLCLTLAIIRDPILLENRTKYGPTAEKRTIQKIIVLCVQFSAIAAFLVPALDRRFGWSNVPFGLSIAGDILILVGMWMVFRVFKANSFGSATVKIAKDQKVISTGPYAIVRNPMYASAAVYFIGMSLALGSYWGLIPSGLTILGFVWRLFDEEKFLSKNLPGYTEYCAKVRWHLIPGLL
ncbi:MAG TPA: isoprenylcysteine carboxylmethyltransferase family protein [Acidobacteriaceae bacterium]|nr:isoprenylcysteine carboxylmethyltransferase family protein [Acidobacteriaceae bacterium]